MRTKFAALATALLIIFVGAGGVYFISQSQSDVKGTVSSVDEQTNNQLPENQSVRYIEEEKDTRVEDWLVALGRELGLEVLRLEDASFEWSLKNSRIEVLGQGVNFDQSADTIVEIFKSSGFNPDDYNLLSQENVQQYGFVKEELACLIRSGEVLVEIRCGIVDKDMVQKLSQEYIVKNMFMKKYDKESSAILVDIIQSTDNHLSGSVQFIEPDEEQPAAGNAGSFLAAYDGSGEWVLVFDGNGSILCANIEPYGFPTDMVPECYDEISGQTVNRSQ